MKLNKFFMLGLAGLAFAACSNEEEVMDNSSKFEGNGMVAVKIVSPTTVTRTVDQTTADVKVTGPVTIILEAENGNQQIDLTAAELNTGKIVKFWNVENPSKVTVSMNGGAVNYNAISITAKDASKHLDMQAVAGIAAYGETESITLNGEIASPADPTGNPTYETGAVAGDQNKKYEMYEASVTLKIPVARLEVSGISHKAHTGEGDPTDVCEYTALTIDGVYLDNIKADGDAALGDYRFSSDTGSGTTATGANAILSEAISAENGANNFMNYDLKWPALVEGDGAQQAYGFNFYAPAEGEIATVASNPVFKIYFASATGNGIEKSSPRYAMITKYKSTAGSEIILRAGHVYRITNAELEDKNIIGDEGGNTLYGVTVTVTEAEWSVQTINADWAEQ